MMMNNFVSFTRRHMIQEISNYNHSSSRIALAVRYFTKETSADKDIELAYTTYPAQAHEDEVNRNLRPVVLLHGLFGAKGNLHSIAKQLSQSGRKIVPFDARNHGDSGHRPEMDFGVMSEDLLGLVSDLKLDQPVFLGHSMGGKSVMLAALSQPEVPSGVIVADVAPQPSPNMTLMKTFAEAMREVKLPGDISVVKARTIARVQLSSVVQDRGILEFLLTNLRELSPNQIGWRVNLDALIAHMEEIGTWPTVDFEPFAKPVLFVFGANSDHFKTADFGRIKSLFPSAHTEVIQGAGHFLHADKPLEFLAVVKEFVKSLDGPAS